MDESPELRLLFHRLNNQLGIILAHAELLEAKASDDASRARASQVVTSALEAMGTAKEIRTTPESSFRLDSVITPSNFRHTDRGFRQYIDEIRGSSTYTHLPSRNLRSPATNYKITHLPNYSIRPVVGSGTQPRQLVSPLR